MLQSLKHSAQLLTLVLFLLVCESSQIWPAGQSFVTQYQSLSDSLSSDDTIAADSVNFVKISPSYSQRGKASYYGPGFHGRSTANGESFDMDGFTAAHRKLPFGTIVRVVNPDNNTTIVVQVNDRGPFVGSRVIDMARGAARCINVNLAKVELEAFKPADFLSGDYCIAFKGTSYEAYRIATKAVSISDSCCSFSEAVRKHRILAAKNPDEDVFLLVSLQPTNADNISKLNPIFLVGTRKKLKDNYDTATLITE